MTRLRREKVEKVADMIPELSIFGDKNADTLLVSWGGTEGTVRTAVEMAQKEGKSVAHAHFNYIMPLPRNTEEVLKGHKRVVVCELNDGQFINYLRSKFQHIAMEGYNRTHGQPFKEGEILDVIG
jgi:2-oxoglutarate ferredoxin oxidoreductase subunit alpha